jgi:hypothetical protein
LSLRCLAKISASRAAVIDLDSGRAECHAHRVVFRSCSPGRARAAPSGFRIKTAVAVDIGGLGRRLLFRRSRREHHQRGDGLPPAPREGTRTCYGFRQLHHAT